VTTAPRLIERRTPEFRLVCVAAFMQGLANFAMLYCVQPLLPVFASEYGISPAQSSLAVSVATAAVAISLLLTGLLTDALGRKTMMLVSLAGSATFTLAAAMAPDWHLLLLFRSLTGVMLAGLPAATMTYLSEELAPRALGLGLGTYIAGSVFGGMLGRLLVGVLADWFSWRSALVAVAATGALGLAVSAWRLPPSRHSRPQRLPMRELLSRYGRSMRDPGLRILFGAGFLLMGSFVTIYNYLGFHLLAAPYGISQTAAAWIFSLYLLGVISAPWIGNLANRLGPARVYWLPITLMLVGVMLTLSAPLWLIVCGVGIMTFGFFGAHSVASGWVGSRATDCRPQASALYLSSFYVGSSVIGSFGGVVLGRYEWRGVALMVCAMLLLALGAGVWLRRLAANDRLAEVVAAP
jgi:YNFM family putative membrane transporter